MSISNALANALTGLNAASRAADVVSSNVANAMTEGYGRRDIELTSKQVGKGGAGVSVSGVTRHYDPVVTGGRRLADAEVALEKTRVDFYDAFATAMGQPDQEGSIGGLITGLETKLIEAASRPDSEARLKSVVNIAKSLTEKLNTAADRLMDIRQSADHEIGSSVEFLQSALNQVVDLNVAIREQISTGYDPNALLDRRQTLVDEIAKIIPVNEVPKENGMIALYSPGGAILVDFKAADIAFDATPTITPDMTLENGALSGLTINGMPISVDTVKGPAANGKLAALFEVRDTLCCDAQNQLDAIARDLVDRFQTNTVDPTLGSNMPGIFTDSGAFFDPANSEGLASRISVNSLIDPAQGGDLWKLRDGLGALSEGDEGNATLLNALTTALQTPRTTSATGLSQRGRTALDVASTLYSLAETNQLDFESNLTYAAARQETLHDIELENGVDTDYEMQRLLVIEQSYSANAKVIQTIQTLLDQLLGI